MTTQDTPEDVIAVALWDERTLGHCGDAWPTSEDEYPDRARARAAVSALSAAGYRIIRTDQLEHGDTLESVDVADPECTNCDGRGCMDCVLRHWHDECEDRCHMCTPVLRRVVGNEQETPQ